MKMSYLIPYFLFVVQIAPGFKRDRPVLGHLPLPVSCCRTLSRGALRIDCALTLEFDFKKGEMVHSLGVRKCYKGRIESVLLWGDTSS